MSQQSCEKFLNVKPRKQSISMMDSPYNASSSPSSNSTNSPPSVPAPTYYRSDSTVVEKPSHFNNNGYDAPDIYSLMNGENSRVEVLVVDQSQPTVCNSAPQSPGSGYNSNKTTDDEGTPVHIINVL